MELPIKGIITTIAIILKKIRINSISRYLWIIITGKLAPSPYILRKMSKNNRCEIAQYAEHPGAENQQNDDYHDNLGNKSKRLVLKLGNRLKHAYQYPYRKACDKRRGA
jgi:hypothetical protein